jgi:hypothetical protein
MSIVSKSIENGLQLVFLAILILVLNFFPSKVNNLSNVIVNPLKIEPPDCLITPIGYKVWLTLPPDDDKIYKSFVSVKKDLFNRECMSELAEKLKQKFKRKSRIKAFLFDNDKIAEGYAKGKYEGRDLHLLMRGMFYFDAKKKQGYIKFSSEEGKPWDEITITL